jgi:uncharacterized protein (TIGR02099 family)
MPRQIARQFINLLWYTSALTIVVAALIVTVGREMLPRLNLESDVLARYLSERAGAHVEFEELNGEWIALIPELSAKAIRISNSSFDITLNGLRVQIDLPNSLLGWAPAFGRLEVNSATINYRSTQTSTSADTSAIDVADTWEVVYALLRRNILIRDVHVTTQVRDRAVHFNLQDFRVEQTLLNNKRVFLRLLGQDGQEDLYAVGNISGNTFEDSKGTLFLDVGDWPLQEWLPADALPLDDSLKLWREANWHLKGQMWFTWQGSKQFESLADITLFNPDTPAVTTLPKALKTIVSVKHQAAQTHTTLHRLDIQDEKTSHTLLEQLLLIRYDNTVWQLQTPALDFNRIMQAHPFLPDTAFKDTLTKLNPQGVLHNISLQWDGNKPIQERLHLRAEADNITTGPWLGVPALSRVSGYLDTGLTYGFIDVNSQNGFSMFYPYLYDAPMTFDRANGRVQWEWAPEEHALQVGSDHIRLIGEAGEANGSFWLHSALPGANFQGQIHLAIGLLGSKAEHRNHFLPKTLPPSLHNWLKQSIGAADLPDAGFLYQGPLSKHDANSQSIQFFANVKNGEVLFDPQWPPLQELNGKVLVDNGITRVRTQSGNLYNTQIDSAWVEVLPLTHGLQVNVLASGAGPTADGIRLLQETPLSGTLGNAFSGWQVSSGQLKTRVQLQLPLQGSTEPLLQDLNLNLTDTHLTLSDLRLPITQLDGELAYHSDTGLTSPALSAQLFGAPVKASILSHKKNDNLTITLHGSGKADALRVAQWSQLTPLLFASGDVDYNVTLQLGPFSAKQSDRIGELKLDSTLSGIELPLPPPLGKTAKEKQPLKLAVNLWRNNRQDFQLQYGQVARGELSMRSGKLFNGHIRLGEKPSSASSPDAAPGPLLISGNLSATDLDAWLDVVTRYNALPAYGNNAESSFPVFALDIGTLTWNELPFPDTHVDIQHSDNAWKIKFSGNRATGTAHFPDTAPQASAHPVIQFHTLKIDPVSETTTVSPDKAVFAEIPALDFKIDQLIFDSVDIGKFQFTAEGTPQALSLHKLQVRGTGYAIKGDEKDSKPDEGTGADLIWRNDGKGGTETVFKGLLHMQGEQPVLSHLGFNLPITGENIFLETDIRWHGSPLDIDVNNLVGTVRTWGKDGKYLQAKPTVAMTAMNVIDVATWVRRLRLDFSDLKNDGISFDKYKGTLAFDKGVMTFADPLKVESPSSQIEMDGKAFLKTGSLDLQLTATLPVGNNAAWIAALAGGLPAAAGVYLVSKIFNNQLETITSVSYDIKGPMEDPDIKFKRLAPPKIGSDEGKSK